MARLRIDVRSTHHLMVIKNGCWLCRAWLLLNICRGSIYPTHPLHNEGPKIWSEVMGVFSGSWNTVWKSIKKSFSTSWENAWKSIEGRWLEIQCFWWHLNIITVIFWYWSDSDDSASGLIYLYIIVKTAERVVSILRALV